MAAGTAETRAAKFFRLASARVKRAVKAILETAMASGSIRRAQRPQFTQGGRRTSFQAAAQTAQPRT